MDFSLTLRLRHYKCTTIAKFCSLSIGNQLFIGTKDSHTCEKFYLGEIIAFLYTGSNIFTR